MHDELTFDARFADAFERYLADAPVEFDAIEVTAVAAAGAHPPSAMDRLARPAWLAPVPRRALAMASLALLLLAMAGTLLLIGSLQNQQPLGGTHLFLTTGPLDCQGVVRIDVRSGASEPVVDCANRLRLAPDGTRAAARGANGIEIIDLVDGSITAMSSAVGSFTVPAAWSPRGTWLHWVSCDENGDGCRGFIGQPGSAAANEIPEPASGFHGSLEWSAEETLFLLSTDEGTFAGAGDGAGLTAFPGVLGQTYTLAPDGLSTAVTVSRPGGGDGAAASDLSLQPFGGAAGTTVTDNPDGSYVECIAWSPDETRIGVVVSNRGTFAARTPDANADLLILDSDGSEQLRWPIPPVSEMDCLPALGQRFGMTWSPDGGHVLLQFPQVDESPPPPPVVVSVESGRIIELAGFERMRFSPDGRSLAVLANMDTSNPDAVDAPATLQILDLETGTPRTVGPVRIGPWSTLVWAP